MINFILAFGIDATEKYYASSMRSKSQTFHIFQKFIRQEENQSGKKLKHLRTNFGEEFANKAFEKYTFKEGFKWHLSALYIQRQNEKSESLNYTLMSSVQFILAAIYLPKTTLYKLIKKYAYLRNQGLGINNITPYKLSHNIGQDLDHLQMIRL